MWHTGAPTMTFDEYRQPDALGLAQLIRTGQVSRQEVLDAMVQRFDAVHPAVNAITCLRHHRVWGSCPP